MKDPTILKMHRIVTHSRFIINRAFILIAGLILLGSCNRNKFQKPDMFEKGVSRKLAEVRKQSIDHINYDLFLDIPSDMDSIIKGNITISFRAQNQENVVLDFQTPDHHLESIKYQNKGIDINFIDHHIYVNLDSSQDQHIIEIDFIAGDQSLNRNEDFLYTLFVPDRASTALPLFDQPNLKATYTLKIRIPNQWDAISNGRLLSMEAEGNKNLIAFEKTKPISSYLFAFAVGKFSRHNEIVGSDTIEFLYRENDPEKLARNIPEIVQLHIDAKNWLENYTGTPYPFNKFGWATIPPFQYGGMEHPGSIFYRERSLFLDKSATTSQYLGRASLIAHEVAHMWFGDLVTMDWFDDVWLKEVFANFMAAKIVQPNYPEINHAVRFLLAHFPAAYSVDRTAGANPILQPLANLNNAGTLYGDIIYHKAPIVMQMLENKLGDETMQQGLQAYLNKYAFSNARWDDLISILDPTENLRSWSDIWVKEPGMPIITIAKTGNNLLIEAIDPDSKNREWPQKLKFVEDEDAFELTSSHQSIRKNLAFQYPDVPYGTVRLNRTLINDLLLSNQSIKEDANKAYSWIVIHEQFINNRLNMDRYLSKLIQVIPDEDDPLILNLLLSYVQEAFNKFSSSPEHQAFLIEFENMLWESIQSRPNQLKKYFFNSLLSIGQSIEILSKMANTLAMDNVIPIALSEQDRISTVYRLALMQYPGWESILYNETQKLRNPDYIKRVNFTAQFLTGDLSTRDSLFLLFSDPIYREHEPWVTEAMRLLNHPFRRDHALKYIQPALEWLEDIQKTGDIFFPKRWLDALFSGHNSPEAVTITKTFLNERPDYPITLKRKILQSVDLVERASKFKSTRLIN